MPRINKKNLGINILRQILKCNYLKMTPKVVSHGYDKTTGKKLVENIFNTKIIILGLFNFNHTRFI